ncbi:MAG: tRNA 2-thiouridine(34) synthase MnmA [Candidatus Pacebacteria bacterium]|nr:tRNA 2-thiouridine(34) synthase MnmA [Candidatus Paceibacterota bacterium]
MTKVFVALSGGVDSSVALALLHGEGYDVTGVYFKTYKPDTNEKASREYCKQQGLDAQAVCKHLQVPFKVYDLEAEYKQKVFDYMIAGYKRGVTPNPDMLCNKEIKFGVFASKAFKDGADMIATGHHARVKKQQGKALLLMGVDESKDQSYFLSQISQDVLQKSLFPIGEYKKSKVRAIAEQYGLHTASKKDSQGICFIGQEIDVKSFLKQYIPEQQGAVLDVRGEIIGTHLGAKFSTIGERHGFNISPEYQGTDMPRLFVIKRDVKENTLTVGTKSEFEKEQSNKKNIIITNCNWINCKPESGKEYNSRIRHRGELYKCKLNDKNNINHGNRVTLQHSWEVVFKDAPYAPASGQFIAVYDGEVCIGGGVII